VSLVTNEPGDLMGDANKGSISAHSLRLAADPP